MKKRLIGLVDGVYLISRKKEDEIVLYIVNKNNSSKKLSLERFSELGIDNMFFKEIYSGQKFHWKGEINLKGICTIKCMKMILMKLKLNI